MKFSKYNLYWDTEVNGEKYYITYNTRSKGAILIDDYTHLMYTNNDLKGIEEFEGRNRTLIRNLKNFKILVDSAQSEQQETTEALEDIKKYKTDSDTFGVWLFMTYACNFKCTYCIENGNLNEDISKSLMTVETAEKIILWIKKKVLEKKSKVLSINYFGGEPTLNLETIYHCCDIIDKEFSEVDVKVEMGMVTNGYLLNEETIDALVEHGVKLYQITVDGPEDIHDSRRRCNNNKPSYRVIINNIKCMVNKYPGKVSCVMKINLDNHNKDSIEQLLIDLKKEDLDNHVVVIAGEVIDTTNNMQHIRDYIMTERESVDALCNTYEAAFGQGYKMLYMQDMCSCNIMNDSYFMFDPFGYIYKCPAFVGTEGMSIGHVDNEQLNELYNKILNLKPWEECLECEYLPLCTGGCRYRNFVDTKEFNNKRYCRKDYLSGTLEGYYKTRFKMQILNND